MRLYIIRHADPDYPNGTITDAGHKEAAALADRLQREQIDRLYTSPLGRAVHTAQHTADRLDLPLNIESWAVELEELRMPDGPCEGSMVWDLHGEIVRTDPQFARGGDPFSMPPLNDPAYRERVERVGVDSDRFLERLGYVRDGGRYRIQHANTERVAVFCHNGFGLTWLAHLLELPLPLVWSGFWMAPSSVTTILLDQRSDGWAVPRCLAFGDTAHLHAAGLPVSPRGIKANFE